MEAAGYQPKRASRASEGALGGRVGHRVLEEGDARLKLDRIRVSKLVEEDDIPGLACFASRIRRDPPVPNFQLPRGTKTYDGSTRPED